MSPQKLLIGPSSSPTTMVCEIIQQVKRVFIRSYADYALFIYRQGDVFMALLVYVDDIVLASNNVAASHKFKTYLHDCFNIKDLGPLKYFLGIEIARGHEGMFLCQ